LRHRCRGESEEHSYCESHNEDCSELKNEHAGNAHSRLV
jgi:hypothetical protein